MGSFHLTLFSSMLIFEMSNETCLDMNEVSLTLSRLQIHQLTFGWLLLTDRWIGYALMNLSFKLLMIWPKHETLASTSSLKPYDDPPSQWRPHLLDKPWLAQCRWLGLTRGQNPNPKELIKHNEPLGDDKTMMMMMYHFNQDKDQPPWGTKKP